MAVLIATIASWAAGGTLVSPSHPGEARLGDFLGSGNSSFAGNNSTGCNDCAGIVNDTLPPIPISGGASVLHLLGTPSALSGYNGHYWLLGDYGGNSTTATDVYTSVVIPNIGPRLGDMYYDDLSIWDNAGHYDQIGITSDYDTGTSPSTSTDDWNGNWVSAPNCGTRFATGAGGTWDPDAGGLSPGTTYTFQIVLASGSISFNVYYGIGNPAGLQLAYSNTTSDSATALLEQGTTTCGLTTSYGYSIDEEVYQTNVQPFPNWDFNFSNNHANNVYTGPWSGHDVCDVLAVGGCPVPTSPHGYYVWTKSGWAFVEIANQAYSFQDTSYPGYVTTPGATVTGLTETAFVVGQYCRTTTCYAGGAYSLPSGWTGSMTFASKVTTVPAVSAIDFHVPIGATQGFYYIWIQLQMSPTSGGPMVEFTSMDIYVAVN